jgi:hypothetical protein
MAFRNKTSSVLAQAIADNSTTQKYPLGYIIQATDPTWGTGEFIYLKGINSTIVGSVVTYHLSTFTTALATSVVGVSNPVAVAMSASVTNEFGWYQISGIAQMGKANTLSLAVTLPLAVASGLVIAAATTNRLSGCVTAAVASASTLVITVPCMISRPTTGGGEA